MFTEETANGLYSAFICYYYKNERLEVTHAQTRKASELGNHVKSLPLCPGCCAEWGDELSVLEGQRLPLTGLSLCALSRAKFSFCRLSVYFRSEKARRGKQTNVSLLASLNGEIIPERN